MRGVNLDQLAAFAAIVDAGSFSAAARRLNLSQPAVSVQIRQLERRLGVRLLERIGRRVEPTDRAAKTVIAAIRALREDHSGMTSQTTPSRASRSSSSRLVGTV